MTKNLLTFVVFVAIGLGCSDSENELAGDSQRSDNIASAGGVTKQRLLDADKDFQLVDARAHLRRAAL